MRMKRIARGARIIDAQTTRCSRELQEQPSGPSVGRSVHPNDGFELGALTCHIVLNESLFARFHGDV